MSDHHNYTTYPINQNSDIEQHLFDFPQFPLQEQDPAIAHQLVLPNPLWNPCTTDPSMQVLHTIPKTLNPLVDSAPSNIIPNSVDVGSCSKEKKIMHKDIERRRRQEMNTLYASLRSLIPRECLRGKRSISDHMNEVTHYIKHLQKKIKELGERRDTLKGTLVISSNYENLTGSSSGSSPAAIVTVHQRWPGVEIVIDSSWAEGLLPLSKVLEWLVSEGFDVVSCISCKVNNTSVCTLKCEVNNLGSENVYELKKKLMDLVQLESCRSDTAQ